MTFETINTERLTLRKIDPEKIKEILDLQSTEEQKRLLGVSTNEDLEKERKRVEGGYETFNKKLLIFHILWKDNEEVLGWCGFHCWYVDHRRAEIGYQIFNDQNWGKGIMSEAMKAVIEYGFGTMNLHRIEAFIGSENKASLRLAEKNGFVKEGVLKEHYCNKGVMEDSVVFGLVR